MVRVAGVPTAGATVALLADRQIIASVVTDGSGGHGFQAISNFSNKSRNHQSTFKNESQIRNQKSSMF
jgi:hypothetical protein